MYEIDSHSKEFDKDFKRLARYNRVLARELMELIADELMPNGRVLLPAACAGQSGRTVQRLHGIPSCR